MLSELITQREKDILKTFDVFYDKNEAGGSSRWLVTPTSVRQFVQGANHQTALMIIDKMLEMVEVERASELRMACLCLKDCDCARNAIFDCLKSLLFAEKGKVEGV